MEINVETEEIDILRQQLFGRRVSRVGKQHVRINRASDSDEVFYKLSNASHTQPARHRAGNFVADQITEHRRIVDVSVYGIAHHSGDFIAHSLLAKKFDVLFPRQRDQNANTGSQTFFEEPIRRWMINPEHV